MSKNDDEIAADFELSLAILDGARTAAEKAGIDPGTWALAVIEEMAYMTVTQRDPGVSNATALGVVNGLLKESLDNIKLVQGVRQRTSKRVLFVVDNRNGQRGDEVDNLINRAIKRGAEGT